MKNIYLTLFLIILFYGNVQSQTWEKPYVGSDSTVLYLPDANVVYWRYGWKRKVNDKNGVVIKGKFPNARYFSYNVYNDDTKMSLGSFTDFEIIPENVGTNPFKTPETNNSGSYTLYVVPEGSKISGENILYFPDSLTDVSVILRHYLPEGNINGGKELAKISLLDVETDKILDAPPSVPIPKLSKEEVKTYLIPLFKKLTKEFEEDPKKVLSKLEDQRKQKSLKINELVCKEVVARSFTHFKSGDSIHSFNLQTQGTYPNNDNYYLTMPIIRKGNEILFVKFKNPKYPKSRSDYSKSNIRYFSMSQGDEYTYNYLTLADKDLMVSDDGYIYIIVADNKKNIADKAKELNINYMPWEVNEKMLLIYRQMLPRKEFEHGINKVKKYNNDKNEKGQMADEFIGDFAPFGKFIDIQQFLLIDDIKKIE